MLDGGSGVGSILGVKNITPEFGTKIVGVPDGDGVGVGDGVGDGVDVCVGVGVGVGVGSDVGVGVGVGVTKDDGPSHLGRGAFAGNSAILTNAKIKPTQSGSQ